MGEYDYDGVDAYDPMFYVYSPTKIHHVFRSAPTSYCFTCFSEEKNVRGKMIELSEFPNDFNSELSDGMGIEDLVYCTQLASPGFGAKNVEVVV